MKLFKTEWVRYLFVGAATSAIYFAIIAFFIELLRVDYRVAVTVAYVSAVSFHFYTNRKFTFTVKHGAVGAQIARYFIVLLANYIATIGVVWYLSERLGLSSYIAAIFAILATVVSGYLASKLWVFKKKEI